MCRYDEFGRLKKQFRGGDADRKAREEAALARLRGSSGSGVMHSSLAFFCGALTLGKEPPVVVPMYASCWLPDGLASAVPHVWKQKLGVKVFLFSGLRDLGSSQKYSTKFHKMLRQACTAIHALLRWLHRLKILLTKGCLWQILGDP